MILQTLESKVTTSSFFSWSTFQLIYLCLCWRDLACFWCVRVQPKLWSFYFKLSAHFCTFLFQLPPQAESLPPFSDFLLPWMFKIRRVKRFNMNSFKWNSICRYLDEQCSLSICSQPARLTVSKVGKNRAWDSADWPRTSRLSSDWRQSYWSCLKPFGFEAVCTTNFSASRYRTRPPR